MSLMRLDQRVRRYGLVTVAGLWFAVCVFSQSTPDKNAGKAAKVFAELRQEWASNLHDKKVDACVAEYATDAEFIGPDGGRVEGEAAIRQLFETITATYDSNLHFTSVRQETSGRWATILGPTMRLSC